MMYYSWGNENFNDKIINPKYIKLTQVYKYMDRRTKTIPVGYNVVQKFLYRASVYLWLVQCIWYGDWKTPVQ